MTNLERYALNDGGESTPSEGAFVDWYGLAQHYRDESETLAGDLERMTAERDELRLTLAATDARMATARATVDHLMEHIEISDGDCASYWVFDQIRQLRALIAADAEREKA